MEKQIILKSAVLMFEMTPLLTKPGWYYKILANGQIMGPFPNRRRAELAVKTERRIDVSQ